MYRMRIVCLMMALVCLLGMGSTALALEVDCDTAYCFTAGDFSAEEEPITGICITDLPDAEVGTAMLGNRVIREGDILTEMQVSAMTFVPLQTELDKDAVMTYLPIYEDRVAPSATMTISVRGKQDKPPVAEDSAVETYKNLPNEGKVKAVDPEGQGMIYTVVRQPKRGEVTLREDGSFLYTPKKNKVGVDSFTFTVTDPAGNVSREATVTVTILKPTQAGQYVDTADKSCRFAAEWMKNTGIFVGEQLGGVDCFQPEKSVSRGEFLTMLVKTLKLPVEKNAVYTGTEEIPDWLKPYMAAASRSGLTAGWPEQETFGADQPITGSEAALMLQNALDLSVTTAGEAELVEAPYTKEMESGVENAETAAVPVWAETALAAMQENGIILDAGAPLTRGEAAQILYQASLLAEEAPGMTVYQ